jgi:hypothetical protein
MPSVTKPNHKTDIVQRVVSATMHLLHNSDLQNTALWPKNGFKSGYGISTDIKDALWVGCNAYGIDADPVIGRMGMNTWNTGVARTNKQFKRIAIIIDQAIEDDIYFEHELTSEDRFIWFKFTIQ